ncbi:hypothetical protein D9758_002902 [Tetrapyrgos nigripes]|uniref:Required for respiratory growth protein 9, mitochondrial n=1 Tax=Tetrapyrgos nigripes TaxID=182062 RepID=A0A8H5LTK8_9AGAR|nr:hypothetical protein D9758_002902 [Tetrapyrgos nigripes]
MSILFRPALPKRSPLKCFYSIPSSAEFLRKWRGDSLSSSSSSKSIFDDDSPVDLSENNDAVNGVRSPRTSLRRKPPKQPTPPQFKAHRQTIQKEFPEGWNPPHKISRDAMDALRQLHHMDKAKFNTPVLAERFRISPEAVRRILKSKWVQPREKRDKGLVRERETMTLNKLKNRLKERDEMKQVVEETTQRTFGIDAKDRLTFE